MAIFFYHSRIAPHSGSNSPETKVLHHQAKGNFRTSPIPTKMLGAIRGYASSAVDDALGFSPRRKYTDETVSSSLRLLDKESCCSEPASLSRSNSLINPVAVTLFQQMEDEDTTSRTSSPVPMDIGTSSSNGGIGESPATPVDELMQDAVDAPPSVRSDPPSCRRPRALRPTSS